MITHILYQLMGKFQIASENFRKVLAVFISLMIFGLMYTVVKFTGMDIPNFTRNLVMLTSIDLAGFGFLVWKQKDEPKNTTQTNIEENNAAENNEAEKPNNIPVENQKTNNIEENNTNIDTNNETDNIKEEANNNGENEEVNRLMAEIIEENRERKDEIEKEMAESA